LLWLGRFIARPALRAEREVVSVSSLPFRRLLMRSRRAFRAFALLSFLALTRITGFGADVVVFGPATYQRGAGQPVTVARTFTVRKAVNPYILRVANRGVTSAVISVNGRVVLGPGDFEINEVRRDARAEERPVTLRDGANQIAVEVRGKPGTSLTVEIVHAIEDATPPTITATVAPAPNANGWNNTTVTVNFSCTDAESGIATCPPPVTVMAEGANQPISGSAVDNAGNRATTSVTVNLDKSPPVITTTHTPQPNGNGWINTPVTTHFTCDDALSGVLCPADEVVWTEGTNLTLTRTVTDLAGNSASVTSPPFNVDLTPPVVTVAVTPPPNANGWNNGLVTAQFVCSDAGSGIAACPSDQAMSVDGAGQSVTGTATDAAGNTATAYATVNVDRTAPVLTLSLPAAGTTVYTSSVIVSGVVTDTGSGIDGATCNRSAAIVADGTLTCVVSLAPGANIVEATTTDRAGNAASASLTFTYVRVPLLTIAAPANLSYTNITPTTVTGTIDDPAATVSVNAVPAAVVNGGFSVALPLAEGPNLITASGAGASATGTASMTVTLDTTPPHVTVTSPPDQFTTAEALISVAGNVNDIVVGTVNDQEARVTVNGAPARIANRTFLATDVPLVPGTNQIQVVATDRVGNAATTQLTVTRQVSGQPHIQLISGNNQTGAIGAVLSAPLVIALIDGLGNPITNTPVVFEVTQADGTVMSTGPPGATVIATTDDRGQAQVRWTLGARAGAGGNSVEAYAVGFEGTAIFTATGTQGPPGAIVVDSGNDQIGGVSQALAKPFIAVVVDTGHNRLGGVPVTFSVERGGGRFDGQSTVTVVSDSDGRVAATLTLGAEEGNANNVVHATFAGNEALAATFHASGRVPGSPALTRVSGVVLDNSNVPIPGVIVRAVLTNELHSNALSVQSAIAAQTDTQGQFTIPQAPVGLVKLLVDGSTAQLPGVYPSLEYDLVTVSGRDNTVGQPIYLLPLSSSNQLCVTATTGGGTLTIPDAPGFSLTFGPGQVTFPGGSKSGCVSVTMVHLDKVPMAPGFGQQPNFIVTIQPAGATFSPAAPMTLPNVDGLRPREVTEMYSFDHDIGSFVAIGTATVSDDGLTIRSNPGVGVLKAGWHCGGNPNATGNAASLGIVFGKPEYLTTIGKTVTVTASGSPPLDGDYINWQIDDPTIGDLIAPPQSCANQVNCSATVRGKKPGKTKVRVTFICRTTGSSITAAVDVTVVEIKYITFRNRFMSAFKPVDQMYKSVATFTGSTVRFSFETVPSNAIIPRSEIQWSGAASGSDREVDVTFSVAGTAMVVVTVGGTQMSAAVRVMDRPSGMGENVYALLHAIDTAKAVANNLIGIHPETLEATVWAAAQYPGVQRNTKADAARHTYWNCALAALTNPGYAEGVTYQHEVSSPGPATETIMDLNNNAAGRALAIGLTDLPGCRTAVIGAIAAGSATLYLDGSHGSINTSEDALLQPTSR
jgi:hypothetical protein